MLDIGKLLEESFKILESIEDPAERELLEMLQREKVDIMEQMRNEHLESWPTFLSRLKTMLDAAQFHYETALVVYNFRKQNQK